MGEQRSASGVAMCFFAWDLLEKLESNIGDVTGAPNFGGPLTGAR